MHLPDFIASNIDSVLDEWERYPRAISAARSMDSVQLRDHARQMLETIVDDLRTPQAEEQQQDKSKGRGCKSGPAGEDSNAVKHGDGTASITLAVSGDAATAVATVHNRGEPIPPDDIGHVFEPMRRSPASARSVRHPAGLGLGLYIAQETVHAHRGTVSVSSSREHGTTFTVNLPRHAAHP